MLDVHVLVMDYTPVEWVDRCRASIEVAASRAGFPVAAHFIPGILGHLGNARAAGYAIGDHPYVTHVDDDDWLEPDAFACLAEHLHAGVDAVTTGESHVFFPSGKVTHAPECKHHLAVYRRDVLATIGYSAFRFHPDQYILSRVTPIHVPQCVYNHQVNVNSGSRLQRRRNRDAARRELDAIKRPDLAVVEYATAAEIAAATDLFLSEASDG